jgi:hypothetical protein
MMNYFHWFIYCSYQIGKIYLQLLLHSLYYNKCRIFTFESMHFHSINCVTLLVFCIFKEILKLLENHALGDIVLKTTGTTLDMSKRMILVDILANDLIVKFER